MSLELTRSQFIKEFNSLNKGDQEDLLIEAGMNKIQVLDYSRKLGVIEISDISEDFDNELVADIWSIMETRN